MKYLLYIALSVSSIYYAKYYSTVLQYDQVLNEQHLIFNQLKKNVQLCETIISINQKTPSYYPYHEFIQNQNRTAKKWDDEYEDLKIDIEYEIHKFQLLNRTPCFTFNKHTFKKDILSTNVFLGTEDFLYSTAEANELYINDSKFELNSENKYTVPFENSLKINYKKYSFNFSDQKIDTLSIVRTITL